MKPLRQIGKILNENYELKKIYKVNPNSRYNKNNHKLLLSNTKQLSIISCALDWRLIFSFFIFSRFERRPVAGRTLPSIARRQLPILVQEELAAAGPSRDVISPLRDVIDQESIAIALAGFLFLVDQSSGRPCRQGFQRRHGHGGVHR